VKAKQFGWHKTSRIRQPVQGGARRSSFQWQSWSTFISKRSATAKI